MYVPWGQDSEWFWGLSQCILTVVGFSLVYSQLRVGRKANSFTVVNALRERWDADYMLMSRLHICKRFLDANDNNNEWQIDGLESHVLGFLEELGLFVRKNAVPINVAWSYYSWFVDLYWDIMKDSIIIYRKSRQDNTWFEDLEWLKKKFETRTIRKNGKCIAGEFLKQAALDEIVFIETLQQGRR